MDKNSIFSKKTQSESDLKSKISLVVVLFSILFLMNFVNSAELTSIDSIKAYDSKTQTITLISTADLTKNIASIKLDTPLIYKVPIGYQKIAEFTINNYYDYENVLKQIKFYDINSNLKEINKVFDYKVLVEKEKYYYDYKEVCIKDLESKNASEICTYEIIANYTEHYTEWEDIDFSLLKYGTYKIGIFTQVNYGDNIEWIPTFYDNKIISEWASYVQSSGTTTTILDGGLYYTIFTFTSNGYFNYTGTNNLTAEILIIGGGGGGGTQGSRGSAGGGAGGLVYANNTNITTGNYSVIVGFGGYNGTNGTSSSFYGMTAKGGGAGGKEFVKGSPGGSGGGGGNYASGIGTTTQTNQTPTGNTANWGLGYGFNGGTGADITSYYGEGGGGGSASVGSNGNGTYGGTGGAGKTYSINGTSFCYAGGGGGGTQNGGTGGRAGCNAGIGAGTYAGGSGGNALNGTGGGGGGASGDGSHSYINNGGMGGSGIVIVKVLTSEIATSVPSIILNSPIAYYNTTSTEITFNITTNNLEGIANVTLYLDGVLNETNTSQIQGDYLFTKTFTEGEHYFSILVYDTDSNSFQSVNRYFTIDYTNPTITITNPLNTTYYTTYTTTNNVTHTYNWTTSDLNLDSCWWSLDDGVTNNTVNCNNNYSFFYPFGQQTFIAWANDSSGNLGVSRVSATWDFMLYELSRFYNSSSVVSASENFILFLNKSSNILTQNVTFKYNGISYPVATTTSGNLINFTTSINIPANANSNNSFNWTIGFTNSTGIFFYNTTSSYQTIANITIAKCSTTAGSDFALNFSTYDATNMTALNTTFEMNFYFYDYTGDGSIVGEFLYTDTSENHSNFLFCMNSSNRNITANAVVSYGAENFDERQYYITNGTISNTVQNISLYLTETDLTDIVNIKLQDQGYVGISGAFISIQEWNVGTNTYSTIGMCQTSSTGDCIMDLELYTTFYRAVVYYDGSIIEITDTQKLSSTSWVITITLEEDNPYDLFENIATSLTFNNLTNITTYTWVDASGYSQRGCLVVKNYTTTGQEIIYNSCTESVSGSIDYLISGDGSYYVYGYIYLSEYGTYKILEYLEIQLGTLEINRVTSPYGKVISFFIIGTLGMIGVAAGSALLGSVLVIIGLILSWKIGFLNITVSFVWSMVVIALLIIVLQNRRQQ